MEILHKTKKPRLVADFTLDHTGGWEGAYQVEWEALIMPNLWSEISSIQYVS